MNVMDEYQFRAIKHRSKEIRELDLSKDTLKSLQSDLVVKKVNFIQQFETRIEEQKASF